MIGDNLWHLVTILMTLDVDSWCWLLMMTLDDDSWWFLLMISLDEFWLLNDLKLALLSCYCDWKRVLHSNSSDFYPNNMTHLSRNYICKWQLQSMYQTINYSTSRTSFSLAKETQELLNLNFSNDPKNISRHCAVRYYIKIRIC